MPKDPIFVTLAKERRAETAASGNPGTTVLSPLDQNGLAMGVVEILVGVDLIRLDTNAGVTIKIEWSWDGVKWKLGSTVIAEQTAADVYTGVFNTPAERTPLIRIVAETRDTVGSAVLSVTLNAWAIYRYSS